MHTPYVSRVQGAVRTISLDNTIAKGCGSGGALHKMHNRSVLNTAQVQAPKKETYAWMKEQACTYVVQFKLKLARNTDLRSQGSAAHTGNILKICKSQAHTHRQSRCKQCLIASVVWRLSWGVAL